MANIFDQEGITFQSSRMASTNPNAGPEKFDVPAIKASQLQERTQPSGPVPLPPDPQQLAAILPLGPSDAAAEATAAAGAAPPQPQAANLFDAEGLEPVGSNAFTRGVYLSNDSQPELQTPQDGQNEAQAYMAQQMAETGQLARSRFTPDQVNSFLNNPVTMAEAIQAQNDWSDVPALLERFQSGQPLDDTQKRRLDEYVDTVLQHNMRGFSWNGNKAIPGQQLPAAAISYLQQGQSGDLPTDGQEPVQPNLGGTGILPVPYTPKAGERAINDFAAVTDKGQQIMASAKDKPAITALKAGVHLLPEVAKNPLATKGALITSINQLPATFRSALFDAVKTKDPKAQMSKVFTPAGFNQALETLGEEEVDAILQANDPSFKERFMANVADAYYNGTLAGAGSQLAATQLEVGQDTEQAKENIKQRENEFEKMPGFDTASGAAAAFLGQVAGSVPSPESFVTLPAKAIMAFGKTMGRAGERFAEYLIRETAINQVVRQGTEAAVVNVATDPAVQGLNVAAGAKEEYDPAQTLVALPLGFFVGAGIKGAQLGGSSLVERAIHSPNGMLPEADVDHYLNIIRKDKDQLMVDSGVVSVAGGKSASAIAAENILRAKGVGVTQEAAELLAKVDAGGVHGQITNNLKRIAGENGVQITSDMSPVDVIKAIREKSQAGPSPEEVVANMTANELDQFVDRHIPTPRGVYSDPPQPAGTPTDDVATAVGQSQVKALNAKDAPPINDSESGFNLMLGKQKLSGGFLYRKFVNAFQPVENAEKLALQRGAKIQPGESPTVLGTLYGNVGSTINHYISVENFKWMPDGSVQVTGKGLKPIMDDFDNVAMRWEPNRDTRTRDFNDYLLAHRYLELDRVGEGKAKPKQVEWSQKRLVQLAEKYGDDLHLVENLAQEVYAFQRRTLDLLVDSGVLGSETRDALNAKYKRYIPLNRQFDQADHEAYLEAQRVLWTVENGKGATPKQEKKARKVMKGLVEKYGEDVDSVLSWHPGDRAAGGGRPMGKFTGAGPQGLIQKLKGSDREVREPLLNIFENTYNAVDRAFRNKVNQSVVALRDVLPEYIQPEKPLMEMKGTAQVKIVHDPVLDQKLDAAIEYFSHSFSREKNVKVAGYKNVLGSYSPQEKMVRSSLGANEAVKTHEVGHLLDYELGIGERLLADKEIKAQLQKLAEERIPARAVASHGDEGMELVELKGEASKKFVAYIKNDREVIANLFDAYVNAPDMLDRIAPKAKAAFEAMIDEKPELAFVKDIKPSLNRAERTVEQPVWGEAAMLPKNTVETYVNGERKLYRVSAPMYEAMAQLGPARVGMVEQIFNGTLGLSASILRFGATSTISFIQRNVFRDQISAMIQGGVAYNPPWDFSKGLFAALGKGKLYQDWERAGGKMSFMPIGDEGMEQALREMLQGEGRLKQAINLLPRVSEKAEQATRLGLYNAAKRAGKSDLEAAIVSLEGTLNFGRGGDVTRLLNRYIPFLNAGVQGVDRIIRVAKNNPKAVAMWGVGTMTIPSVVLTGYYLYAADEQTRQEYLEIPQWQKDMFWVFKVGDEWRSLPKPFSLGYLFSSIPERVMTWSYYQGRDDARDMWAGMFQGLFGSLLPVNDWSAVIPPVVKVAIEWQTNYNLFFGRDIYPEWMEDLPPEQRKKAYTSQTATILGEMIGQSPAKIENTIRGLTGGLGGYGLRAGDWIIDQAKKWNGTPVAEKPLTDADNILIQGFTIRDPIGSNSNSVQEFFDNYQKAKQAHMGQKNIADEDKADYIEENQVLLEGYRGMDLARKSIAKLMRQTSRIYKDPDMSGDQKLEQLREINAQITDIAREANIQYNQSVKGQEE